MIGELTSQSIFHKTCFKCSHCSIQVDVHNYGSAGGVIYCKVHLKTVAKVEQAKGEYFISPLAQADPGYKTTSDIIESNSESSHHQQEERRTSPAPEHRDEEPTHDADEPQQQVEETRHDSDRDEEEAERAHEVESAPPQEENRSDSPAPVKKK